MADESPKDLNEQSLDELERMMAGFTPDSFDSHALPAPSEAPPPVEIPIERSIQTEPAPSESEKTADDAEPQDSKSPEPENLDIEIMRAREEQLRDDLEHWKRVAGRHGGEIGFLQTQIQKIKDEVQSRLQSGEDWTRTPEPTQEPSAPPLPTRSDPIKEWTILQAKEKAVRDFWAGVQNPSTELSSEITEYIKAHGPNRASVTAPEDPMQAHRGATDILEEAYHHVLSRQRRERLMQLEAKRADQVRNLDQAKRKSAMSASGSVPAPPPRPKSLEEMTLEELAAKMEAFGPPPSTRRRR